MRIRIAHEVPDVEPDRALRWWWDFQGGDHDHSFLPLSPDRVVRPVDEGEVFIHDRVDRLGLPLFQERVLARIDGYAIRFDGHNNLSSFTGAYTFRDRGGTTRIELDADVQLRPALAWSRALAQPLVERILERDLQGHVERMRQDLHERQASPHASSR